VHLRRRFKSVNDLEIPRKHLAQTPVTGANVEGNGVLSHVPAHLYDHVGQQT
jgi:hypothetical protein